MTRLTGDYAGSHFDKRAIRVSVIGEKEKIKLKFANKHQRDSVNCTFDVYLGQQRPSFGIVERVPQIYI